MDIYCKCLSTLKLIFLLSSWVFWHLSFDAVRFVILSLSSLCSFPSWLRTSSLPASLVARAIACPVGKAVGVPLPQRAFGARRLWSVPVRRTSPVVCVGLAHVACGLYRGPVFFLLFPMERASCLGEFCWRPPPAPRCSLCHVSRVPVSAGPSGPLLSPGGHPAAPLCLHRELSGSRVGGGLTRVSSESTWLCCSALRRS